MALVDNLISYWALDEASGNLLDSHSTNHLTDTNTVGATTGLVSGCREFAAASNEYGTISDNAALSSGDVDFTFAGWAYLTDKSAIRSILCKGASLIDEYILWYRPSGVDRYRFQIYNAGAATYNTVDASNYGSPATSTWTFIVCWHDSVNNQIGIQVNNGTANTTATTVAPQDGTASFQIGAYRVGDVLPWQGRLDEWGFWKGRVLPSDERTDLYNGGAGRNYAYVSGGGAAVTRGMPFGMRGTAFNGGRCLQGILR